MLVFDASGSMGTTDYALKVPRMTRVKQSLAKVVPEVAPFRRLGLIVYGEGAYDDCRSIALHMRPTANAADQLLGIVADINPRGRTPLTESVRQAAEVLDYAEREAVIVLLTDGEETCGGDPCKTASLLKQASRNLTIHVIGYREGQSQQYFNAQCMAHETGGQYFPVSSDDELIDALRKTLGCPFLTRGPSRLELDRPGCGHAVRDSESRGRAPSVAAPICPRSSVAAAGAVRARLPARAPSASRSRRHRPPAAAHSG